MAVTDPTTDQLGSTAGAGFTTSWDWKGMYMSTLAGDGYERFSQYSATPDSSAIFGGPARFTALSGSPTGLIPIGLSDNLQMSSNPALAQLFEIGSNRSFFTRGKTQNALTFGRMLANQNNILAVLTSMAYHPSQTTDSAEQAGAATPNANIMMNLDSEYFAVPFGMMLIMKTRGGGTGGNGQVLAAVYLEYCMFQNYQFSISNSNPVIQEGISIAFDRVVPIALG